MIESYPEGIALAWDPVDNANSYRIYGCDTPDGTYTYVQSTDETSIVLAPATLDPLGLSGHAFFKVSADTAVRSQLVSKAEGKTKASLLPVHVGKNNIQRTLQTLQ